MSITQHRINPTVLFLVALVVAVCPAASGQIVKNAVSISAAAGPGLYFGEFNSLDYQNTFSPSIGFDQDLSLRYNPSSRLTVGAKVGLMRLTYDVFDYLRLRYGRNFFGPPRTATYPGTAVAVTSQNHIDITKYLLIAQTNFQSDAAVVPFFTFGIGVINFSVTNDDGDPIPTNVTGTYSSKGLIIPLGGGVQYVLNDIFSFYFQGLFYINSSDYLDGYAHYIEFERTGGPTFGPGQEETPSDYMASVQIGASLTIWQPDRPEEPAPPPPIAQKPPTPQPEQPQPPDSVPQVADTKPPVLADPELDSDGDGLSNRDEREKYFTNPDSADTDGDNLTDREELQRYESSPNNADTDGDSLSDGSEAIVHNTDPLLKDTDFDRLGDGEELHTYGTNPLKYDTDDDRLSDGTEIRETRTDPLKPDTDGDGVIDGLDECPTVPGRPEFGGCPQQAIPVSRPEPPLAADTASAADQSGASYNKDRYDFSGIYFQVNSDDFDLTRPETAHNLGRMLEFMQQCDDMGVVIEGHSSSEGNPVWNQRLSEQRAARVREWLIANGVDRRKLEGTVGFGSALPKVSEPASGEVAPSVLENIRRQNRRITMLVTDRCQ
jgi:outer membrane protein OmpA-like peptidoglycan-associated protein